VRQSFDPRREQVQTIIELAGLLFWAIQPPRRSLIDIWNNGFIVSRFNRLSYENLYEYMRSTDQGRVVLESLGSTQGPTMLVCDLGYFNALIGGDGGGGGGGGSNTLTCACTDPECCNGDEECLRDIDWDSEFSIVLKRRDTSSATSFGGHLAQRGGPTPAKYVATEPDGTQVILHMIAPSVCNQHSPSNTMTVTCQWLFGHYSILWPDTATWLGCC